VTGLSRQSRSSSAFCNFAERYPEQKRVKIRMGHGGDLVLQGDVSASVRDRRRDRKALLVSAFVLQASRALVEELSSREALLAADLWTVSRLGGSRRVRVLSNRDAGATCRVSVMTRRLTLMLNRSSTLRAQRWAMEAAEAPSFGAARESVPRHADAAVDNVRTGRCRASSRLAADCMCICMRSCAWFSALRY